MRSSMTTKERIRAVCNHEAVDHLPFCVDVICHGWVKFITERYPDPSTECPRCDECGGRLKPATISFGQAMPEEETHRAFTEAGRADLLVTVGTSLQVYPAAGIPEETLRNGGHIAIVNNQPTGLDSEARVVLCGSAGNILKALIDGTVGN